MVILVSILISIFAIVLFIPSSAIQSHEFKKVVVELDGHVKKTEVFNAKSPLDKISNIGLKALKFIKVPYDLNRKRRLLAKLQQAGLSKTYSFERFLGLKLGMLLFGFLYAFVLSLLTPNSGVKIICFAVATLLYFWPNLWIENKIKIRRHGIQKEMPFVLSSMAVIVESGMSLMQAIKEISDMKEGSLVDEFRTTLLEIEVGFSRVDAFERMINRVQVTELSVFLSAMIQSIEKGSSGIAILLKKQADEMWMKRKEKAKTLAEKASIKLFLPLLLFVLPAMMIFILTPAIMSLITMFK